VRKAVAISFIILSLGVDQSGGLVMVHGMNGNPGRDLPENQQRERQWAKEVWNDRYGAPHLQRQPTSCPATATPS